jgi:hypothetical protein
MNTTTTSGNPTDPGVIQSNLAKVYQGLGVAPTGRGTGPTDIAYYADQVAKTGGWTPDNAGYWSSRIASDLKGGGGAAGATTPVASYVTPMSALLQPSPMSMPQPLTPALQAPRIG